MTRWLALLTVVAIAGSDAHARPICKANPRIVAACFTVHGRVGVYNGIPIRIWVVGAHRMLRVTSPDGGNEEDGLPDSVLALLKQGAPQELVVFGDYEICPLAKEHAGWMRPVCVESASHLAAVKTATP